MQMVPCVTTVAKSMCVTLTTPGIALFNGSLRGDGCVNIFERRSSIALLHTVALRIEPSNCIAHLLPYCAVLRKKERVDFSCY